MGPESSFPWKGYTAKNVCSPASSPPIGADRSVYQPSSVPGVPIVTSAMLAGSEASVLASTTSNLTDPLGGASALEADA